MITEISIGIIIGASLMAWLLRSTMKENMKRWEDEIHNKAVEDYKKLIKLEKK